MLIPLWRLLRWGSPLPIPNREVKPTCADGTWSKTWESMSMPILQVNPHYENSEGFLFYLLFYLTAKMQRFCIENTERNLISKTHYTIMLRLN